ncbi:MAG TPA: TonB-dependent receptor [Allosphingosinicella sp.]|jgi:iron complex outermembrane receptor protein
MKISTFLLASTMLAAGAAPAAAAQPSGGAAAEVEAQDPAEAAEEALNQGDHVHEQVDNDIVVTAPFVRNLNVLAGTQVLTGDDLIREMRPQLGDTLARLPGVSATSFSPGASRPVLRGFQGERVRVLVDGIGSIDVSNTSADHAVTIDPLTADRIEVLQGPAVLLFGSQAIGGAVNVFDRRIPREIPEDGLHFDALGTYSSAANERSIGTGVDLALTRSLAVHLDASYRNTDDVRIGGFVLSPTARAEQLASAEEEEAEGHTEEADEAREFASLRGRLPNSFTETRTLGAGAALIRENGSLGFSVSYYGSRYGVPERPGAGHHGGDGGGEGGHSEHADVSIDLDQIRADLRSEIKLGGALIDRLRLRLGYADYEHTEFEGDEVGTIFQTDGVEGRLELGQADRGGWSGVTGAQFFSRSLSAVGEEAFLPRNTVDQFGLFTLQELESGPFEFEVAARYEHGGVSAPDVGIDRRFDTVSVAAGLSFEVAPLIRVGANLSRAERAPSAEELLSNGPHAATQSFEIGDPDLRPESSVGGELYVRAQRAGLQFNASVFYNRFQNFIFQAATGEEQDELPVFRYFQQDATHLGFEAGASATVYRRGEFRFVVDGVADYVRATIENGGGPIPRIPPLRLLGGIEAQSDKVNGRLEVERVFRQNRVAELETPTPGFTLVNASLAFRPWGRSNPTSIVLAANNIFDVDARRHASFTREFSPLAGRDIRLSARVSF